MKLYFFLLSIMASAVLMAQNTPPCKMPWSQPATHIQSTSAYAVVTIDGSPADVKDKVGIFAGQEIRGIGNIVVKEGVAYMAATLIQGGQAEALTFKLWDESLCKVLYVAFTANSKPGGSIGLPPNYLKLNAQTNRPPTALALSKASVPENSAIGTVVGKFSATDPDAGDAFTYAVSGADASFFKVQGDELRLALSPDYEAKSKLAITTTVTDAGGKSFSKDFVITVTDVDDTAPVITASDVSLAENTTNFSHQVTANEPADFSLVAVKDNGSFKLTKVNDKEVSIGFKTPPDFEKPEDTDKNNRYELELRATDKAGNVGKKAISITVTDVLEQAVISLPARLAFAHKKINATATKDLTIKNTGNIALNVTAITYPAGFTGDWQRGAIVAGSEKTVKVTFKPTATKDYVGTITVESNAGAGTNTLAISGRGILITGTSEPQAAFPGLSIFPNPAEDMLHLKLPAQSPVSLQLTDVNGQVVYERKAVTGDKLSIDVSGYNSGVYVLVLQTRDGRGSKVVKQKVIISSQ